jgi:hypothetical protein
VTGGGHTSPGRSQPIVDLSVSGIRKGGARGLNTPTREVVSCE